MANIDKLFVRISELNLTAKKVSDATGISTGNLSDWKKAAVCHPLRSSKNWPTTWIAR